ncbi:MAG: helix-turn-helix domain-containing protein [Bacillus subtilis]|nr:helix-turn-helix domain-containing protein [Bacillus subtilis]
MIQNKNQIVTRDELLNQVWGYDFVGETRTVDVHIKELRAKTECGRRVGGMHPNRSRRRLQIRRNETSNQHSIFA